MEVFLLFTVYDDVERQYEQVFETLEGAKQLAADLCGCEITWTRGKYGANWTGKRADLNEFVCKYLILGDRLAK